MSDELNELVFDPPLLSPTFVGETFIGGVKITGDEMNILHKFGQKLNRIRDIHHPSHPRTDCPDGLSGCLVLHLSKEQYCDVCSLPYPCPTIRAIEN